MKKKENYSRFFSIKIFNTIANRNARFHRVSTMALDHFLMCLLIIPMIILLILLVEKFDLELFKGMSFYIWVFIISIYYHKDFFNAKSPAKRIMGYQIIDLKTGNPATELQCFVRNFTVLIWPVEIGVVFFNPERRIGDYLANTKIVLSKKEELKTIWYDFKKTKLKRNYIGIIIVGIVYFYVLSYVIP